MIRYFAFYLMAIALTVAAIIFGADREVARRDYVKNLKTGTKIAGCLYDINCNHYNKLLEKKNENDNGNM